MADAMTEIQGTCDERFAAVRTAFQHHFDDELEVGATVAVFLEGEPVVELWGGSTDKAGTTPGARHHHQRLVDHQDDDQPVCAHLGRPRRDRSPRAGGQVLAEFKANDKGRIEVRHLLAHTAGLAGWERPVTAEDLYDWEKVTSFLAAQAPWWEPGTASGYDAVTQGYLVGEVVRRVTGQSLGRFFAQEVAGPLGADFSIGLPTTEHHRVAPLVGPETVSDEALAALQGEMVVKVFANPILSPEVTTEADWLLAELPAVNGQGNARGVAAVQSIVSNHGEAHGVRLMSTEGVEAIFEEQSNGLDLVLGVPLRFGIGYALANEQMPLGPRGCRWGGAGGSVVVSDLDARITIAYVMNMMGGGLVGDPRANLIRAAMASLEPH